MADSSRNVTTIEAEKRAREVVAAGSRQITIRLNNSEIALAKRQAEAKGLKYQTYIKMLLHEALARNQPAAR
jgi:predicted DNA binding CopG/RHH family protein